MNTGKGTPGDAETVASADLFKEVGAIARRLGPASVLAVIAAALPALGGFALLYFIDTASTALREHQNAGLAIYTLVFALTSGLALLPTYAQALLGGWAFGVWIGVPAALVGFTGGALIGYAVARRASGERVTQLINEKPKWRAVYEALLGGGFWRTLGLITLLRIPPNSPFAITNLVMAATRVPLVPYIIGTIVGMAPRTAVAVYFGSRLEGDFSMGRPWWMILASIICAIIILAVIGHIGNRAIARVTGATTADPEDTPTPAD